MESLKRIPGEIRRGSDLFLILIYLGSIVSANLIITKFGPAWSIITAFIFIGLDLTCRDLLHESWRNEGLFWKMLCLIGIGSALSYLLNRESGQIAVASFVAFSAAGITDALIYHLLRDKTRFIKINGSNIPSAGVDSIIFPTLAFGGLMPLIVIGQFVVKVLGGFVWSIILKDSNH